MRERRRNVGAEEPEPPNPVGRGAVQRRALPRTTGDMVRVQRRARGAADGASPEATAERGVEGPGERLPYLDVIQASFGNHDVGGVQAHRDGAAAEASRALGADAFAYGDQVAFAGTPDLHTAAHEAAHVVQQRAGVHLSGGIDTPGDSYERHADAVADRVVAGQPAGDLLDQVAPGGGAPAVQRKVVVNGLDLYDDAMYGEDSAPIGPTDYYSYVKKALLALPEELRPDVNDIQLLSDLERTLKEWAESGTGGIMTVVRGESAHDRVYASWEQLGRALIGSHRSSANMGQERDLAKAARTSGFILGGVAECMRLIKTTIDAEFGAEGQFHEYAKKMRTDLAKLRSRYWWWYLGADIFKNLENPAPGKLDRNVSIIHDLEDYFRYSNKWKKEAFGDWKKEQRVGTVADEPDNPDSPTEDKDLGDYRTNWTSVKEDNPWIQTARAHEMPVWAGPSVTTGRMLTFARRCGAGKDELTALAWGVWAFWNTSYYSGMSGIHTFHEVMDVARQFGVHYEPFKYPDKPPG